MNPAKLLGQSEDGRAGYTDIRVSLKPEAEADSETLDGRLKQVRKRCPMSDNISNTTPDKIDIV